MQVTPQQADNYAKLLTRALREGKDAIHFLKKAAQSQIFDIGFIADEIRRAGDLAYLSAHHEALVDRNPIFKRALEAPERDSKKVQETKAMLEKENNVTPFYTEAVENEMLKDIDKIPDRPEIYEKRNKGGMPMQMQMSFMNEGGLKDEGGETDPESGNEVPSGSLKKEVRDDMPTMLSEGEFVFPADVVRYIGLEKLMKLRQDAKQGLKMMEEMGQMGNSDEATMPDDLPFGMADLVVIAGGKDEPKEMAEGGVLRGQQGLFADPRFASQRSAVQTYTPAQIENIRSGLGGQFAQIQEDIKPTEEVKTDAPAVTTPEVVAEKTPEPESGYDKRRNETRGFNDFIAEQEGHGGAFATIKQYEDRDAVDWLKAATDINSLAGDIVTKLPIVGDLVGMSYQGARKYVQEQKVKLPDGTFKFPDSMNADTKFALQIFEKSKKPKGILSVLKDVFQGKTLKEAFTPEEYKELTEAELAEIKAIRDRAKTEAKKRRDEYNNMSAADRTQRRQFLNVGVYNDGSGTIIQMKGDQVLYQTGGRNVYVNISDIIKQGDDPSLLMERILQKKPTFDSSGQYTGLSDTKPLPAYVQENANISNQIETNLENTVVEEVAEEVVEEIEENDINNDLSYLDIGDDITVNNQEEDDDLFKNIGLGNFGSPIDKEPSIITPNVENILAEAENKKAPEITSEDALDFDLNYDDFTDLEKTAELTVPKLPDEFLDATDPYITLSDGSLFDTTGYDPDQIKKMFPTDKKVVTSDPAAITTDVATVDSSEVDVNKVDPLRNVNKFKSFFSSVVDKLTESSEAQRKRQEQIALELKENQEKQAILEQERKDKIRRAMIARKDAARDAEVEQAKKDSASQALRKQTFASGEIDQAKPFQNLSTQKSSITGESEQDVVDRIRRRQKDEAYKAAIALKNQQPTYVPPTAPPIKYDAPTGPFAKGGLAKMKAKKPAKKRKGGLASKKK